MTSDPVRFPSLRGRSLAGSDLLIPDDLAGRRNVLLLAFWQRHQSTVDEWITALGAAGIATTPPHDEHGRAVSGRVDCVLYELPLLGGKWTPFRRFIDGGMATNIAAPDVLARTVTVYGQIGEVEAALSIPDRAEVVAVVVDGHDVTALQRGRPTRIDEIVDAALAT